jgi:transposase
MTEGSGRCAAVPVVLDEETRGALQRIASSAKARMRQVLRAKIVPAAAGGAGNAAIARRPAVCVNTIRKWRGRFAERGLEGLKDAARSGRPRRYDDLVRVAVVAAATGIPPGPATTWTRTAIAAQVAGTVSTATSASRVGGLLAGLDLKPHEVRGWLTRRDTPEFWDRVRDICALYRTPPKGAIVLSIDEKTAIPSPRATPPLTARRAGPSHPARGRVPPPRHRLRRRRAGGHHRADPDRDHPAQQRRDLHRLPGPARPSPAS